MGFSLDEWNQKFGNQDLSASTRKSGGGTYFTPEMDVTYGVTINSATVTTGPGGDVQLELQTSVTDAAGSEDLGATKIWVTLPYQESDLKATDPESVNKRTLRRRDDLNRLFSKAVPATFALYASKDGKNFLDFDGKVMTKEMFSDREVAINIATLDKAAELHGQVGQTVDELAGVHLYIIWKENPQNEKYPFMNLYPNLPKAKK